MKKTQVHHKQDVASSSEPREVFAKKNWVPFIFVGALVVLFLFLKFTRVGGLDLNTMKTKTIPEVIKKVINNPSTKYEITNLKETNGMIEFGLKVAGQQYTSYMSRDGKLLFTSGIKVDELNKPATQATSAQKTLTCNDIPKVEKPTLDAFVVANCPFGLQLQRVFKVAMADAPDLSDYLRIKYIGAVENGKITAMHGDEEAQENLKQICIRDEQKDLYWPYVSCYMQAGKTDECLASTGVNTSELTACTTDANRGLKYAQADFDYAKKFNVSGSPTLISNEKQLVSEFDFGGRNPDAVKQLICCGAKNKPEFCSQTLSKADVAVSLSLTDEAAAGTASTSTAAGCAPAK